MEALPAELLERVLTVAGTLAPADLVLCRAVCRRWRAAVDACARRDRAFYYACHDDVDLRALEEASPYHARKNGFNGFPLPCACGVLMNQESDAHFPHKRRRGDPHMSVYAAWHNSPLPPARWEILAGQHAIAVEIAKAGRALTDRVHAATLDLASPADSGTAAPVIWVPAWIYLPPRVHRPTSTSALRDLIEALFALDAPGEAELFDLLSDAERARAHYTAAERTWRDQNDLEASYIRRAAADQRREASMRATPADRATLDAYTALVAAFPQYEAAEALKVVAPVSPTAIPDPAQTRQALWVAFQQQYPNGEAIVNAHWELYSRTQQQATEAADEAPLIEDAQWVDAWLSYAPEWPSDALPNARTWEEVEQALARAYGGPDDIAAKIACTYPSGWEVWQWAARRSVLLWRLAARHSWTRILRSKYAEFSQASGGDDRLLADLIAGQVEAVDNARRSVEAHCSRTAVVVRLFADGPIYIWIGGLSTAGHLVGALGVFTEPDND